MERLKIRKKGEGEIPQTIEKENINTNKTEKKAEKTESKETGKRIISAKKRLSSAKPSKEISKRVADKKVTNRIQSAKPK